MKALPRVVAVLALAACSSSGGLGSGGSDGAAGGGAGASGAGGISAPPSDAADAPAMTSDTARDSGVNCNCGRGAYVPMCGIDGKTYDAACGVTCVPVKVACEGQCPCAAGAQRPCNVNGDCAAGQACYSLSGACMSSFGGFAGWCVARTTATCHQSIGSGCPCLDPARTNCPENAGGYCQGADDPTACWTCHLPV